MKCHICNSELVYIPNSHLYKSFACPSNKNDECRTSHLFITTYNNSDLIRHYYVRLFINEIMYLYSHREVGITEVFMHKPFENCIISIPTYMEVNVIDGDFKFEALLKKLLSLKAFI